MWRALTARASFSQLRLRFTASCAAATRDCRAVDMSASRAQNTCQQWQRPPRLAGTCAGWVIGPPRHVRPGGLLALRAGRVTKACPNTQ